MSTRVLVHHLFSLTLLVSAWPAEAQAPKVIAELTKGEVEVKHGAETVKWKLKKGKLSELSVGAGAQKMTMLSFELSYWKTVDAKSTDDSRVELQMGALMGPGKVNRRNLTALGVFNKGQVSLAKKGADCTFTLTKLDAAGIEGTGTCKGTFETLDAKPGLAVSDVKFTASP
ncbi:MAG: hypothetical protein IT384_03370 [Deltaproteobacteria bacterium]|nr:hypothetical protein [Deltaproteobacteria bacterium]